MCCLGVYPITLKVKIMVLMPTLPFDTFHSPFFPSLSPPPPWFGCGCGWLAYNKWYMQMSCNRYGITGIIKPSSSALLEDVDCVNLELSHIIPLVVALPPSQLWWIECYCFVVVGRIWYGQWEYMTHTILDCIGNKTAPSFSLSISYTLSIYDCDCHWS